MAPSPTRAPGDPRWTLLAVAALVVSLGAFRQQRPGPPDVGPGTKIYGIQLERSTSELWPTAGPATPFTVEAIRGSWLLLDSTAIPRGPVWVNFDEVITFRHNP